MSKVALMAHRVTLAFLICLGAGCVFYDTATVSLNQDLAGDANITSDVDDLPDLGDIGDVGDIPPPCETGACCVPETDEQLCDRLVLGCGEVVALDNCGAERTAGCGTCTAPASCGGGGTPNVCACSAQTDAEFCALNAECGAVTNIDACGLPRTLDCGTCTAPETCGGRGAAGTCGCATESDAVFCNRQSACGLLTAPDNCGLPRSADCGGCEAGSTCSANTCMCVPEDDPTFCARLNGCETLTAVDNCAAARTVDCGMCGDNGACTNSQCACTPEDDATFCARLGAECGGLDGTDNCASARSVASCGACLAGETCSSRTCDAAFPPAGLNVWLRSDDGLTVNAQGRVESWSDRLTGEAWNPPSNSTRPTRFTNGAGGFDSLRFYGGQWMVRSGAIFSAPRFTAFVVAKRTPTTKEGVLLGVHGASPAGNHELVYGSTDTTMRFASASGLSFSASVLPTTNFQALTFRADGSVFEFFQGAALTASTPHVPGSNFEFDTLGVLRFDRGLLGDVQEVLVWPRALSEAERVVVIGYLTSRYGF